MRSIRLSLFVMFLLASGIGTASAQPRFVNGLVIPGTTLDATNEVGANKGRFGAFSDMYYDPVRNEWWALSDRGPGGGLLDYGTRLQRFEIDVHPGTGKISNFRIVQTVKFSDLSDILQAPTGNVADAAALNGLNPLLLNNNAGTLGRSFDPEGLVVDPHTGNFLVADEYGPSVYEFDRTGRFVAAFEVPANLVPKPGGITIDYVSGRNPDPPGGQQSGLGRQDNRGYEGLAISPDGRKLFAVLQDPLINEGPTTNASDNDGRDGRNVRIVVFDNDPWSGTYRDSIAQYAYQLELQDDIAQRILDAGGTATKASVNPGSPDPRQGRNIGLSAIVALNDHEFLVIERDNRGIGVDNPAGRGAPGGPIPGLGVVGSKRVYKIDIDGATNVSSIDLPDSGILTGAGPGGTDIVPVQKNDADVFIDLAADTLLPRDNQAEKWEGLTIGPALQGGRHLILAGNDSDYSVTQSGSGTQFDVYVDFKGGSMTRDIDQPTTLNGLEVGAPPAGYSLLPSVLHAYRASAEDLAGYEPPSNND